MSTDSGTAQSLTLFRVGGGGGGGGGGEERGIKRPPLQVFHL